MGSGMTDVVKRRRRLSRGALRALAWIAGGAAFAAPFASLALAPRPATATASAPSDPGRRVILVKKITRRVVVHPAPSTAAVRYVNVGSGSSGSTSSSSSSSSNSGPVAAGPPPAPTTSTGGS